MTQLMIPLADRITRQNQFWYGDGIPSPLMGRQGDYYFRFDQVGVYYKDTTVTWTQYGESGGAFDPVYLFDNLIYNGDFGLWTFNPSTSYGYSASSQFTNFWSASTTSGATTTVTKDTVNLDPDYNTNYVVNVALTCIGGTDSVSIFNPITTIKDVANFNPVLNHPLSMSSRIKLVSGSVEAQLYMQAVIGGIATTFTSPAITLTNTYFTFKFENQLPVSSPAVDTLIFGIIFQGNGTVTISNMMVAVNPAAPNFRPQLIPISNDATNLLTNGGFEIWQRGNGPFAGGYSADRWAGNLTSGDTMSISRESGAANIDVGSQYCAAVTYTRSTGGSVFSQVLSDQSVNLRGRTISFSGRVKCSTPNAVRLRIYDGTANYSAYHSGSGTYETLSLTRPLAISVSTLFVDFIFDASCTAYVDNAMLVVGSVPADYAPLHPADDLARCLRYYETIGPGAWYPTIWGYQTAGGFIAAGYPYKARKAITPSVTQAGTFVLSNATGGGPISSAIDGLSIQIGATATGTAFLNSNSSGYYIAEANP